MMIQTAGLRTEILRNQINDHRHNVNIQRGIGKSVC